MSYPEYLLGVGGMFLILGIVCFIEALDSDYAIDAHSWRWRGAACMVVTVWAGVLSWGLW